VFDTADAKIEPADRPVVTAVSEDRLEQVIAALDAYPETFTPHPKLERILAQRTKAFEAGQVDWSLAEALAFGIAEPLALGRADALALARGAIDGEADGRGVAGAGNTGGSTKGDSMRRSIVRAKPSDCARSSSASVAPNVARRRRCVTFALSFDSGEIQSTSPASFGAAIPLIGGCSATPGRTLIAGSVAGLGCGTFAGSRS